MGANAVTVSNVLNLKSIALHRLSEFEVVVLMLAFQYGQGLEPNLVPRQAQANRALGQHLAGRDKEQADHQRHLWKPGERRESVAQGP